MPGLGGAAAVSCLMAAATALCGGGAGAAAPQVAASRIVSAQLGRWRGRKVYFPSPPRNSSTTWTNLPGSSKNGRWPLFSKITKREPGMALWIR